MTAAQLASLTLRDAPAAMAALRALRLTMAQRWAVLALAVSLSSLLAGLLAQGLPPAGAGSIAWVMQHPFALAGLQFLAIAGAAGLMAGVGRIFGGHGDFPDALLVLGWVDLLVIAAQIAQVILALALPPLAALMSLATLALYVWLLVRMTAALHGFRNPFAVALGIVATLMLLGATLSLLLGALGIMPVVEGLQ